MLDELEKSSKNRQEIETLCHTLADSHSDLSPAEKKIVEIGCKTEGLAHYDAAKEMCEGKHKSDLVFGGWRQNRCETSHLNQLRPILKVFTDQKAEEIRPLRPVPPAPSAAQHLKELAAFAYSGFSPDQIRELGLPLPTEPLEHSNPGAPLPGQQKTTPKLGAPVPERKKGPPISQENTARQEVAGPSQRPVLMSEDSPLQKFATPEKRTETARQAVLEDEVAVEDSDKTASLREESASDATAPAYTVLHTYKVGLRAPEGLIEPITALVRKCQVLRFLRRRQEDRFTAKQKARLSQLQNRSADPRIQAFEEFKLLNTVGQAPETLIATYQQLFQVYSTLSGSQLQGEYTRVKIAFANHKTKKPQLGAVRFERADVPQFQDSANPLPSEISLHDYEYLASRSVKLICAHLNRFAVEHIDRIPTDREDLIAQAAAANPNLNVRFLRQHPYKAASIVLGKGANLDQMALEPMLGMLEVYGDLQEKVQTVNALLFPPLGGLNGPDFSDVSPVLLLYYSIPVPFLAYLATRWKVERQWVRNTLVGWRRKIDPDLPVQLQLEAVGSLMGQLAAYCRPYARSSETQQVLFLLQLHHVLHLLQEPGIDLRPLVPESLHAAYAQLRRAVPAFPSALQAAIQTQTTSFSSAQLQRGGAQFKARLEAVLKGLPADSPRVQPLRTLLHKIEVVLQQLERMAGLFAHYVPGNRYTRAITTLLLTVEGVKKTRMTRLFTTLRGIIACTFAQLNPGATGYLQRILVPQRCLTLPYKSQHRKKQFLPAHLIFDKWVVERQASPELKHRNAKGQEVFQYLTNREATQRFQQGQPIWLGIPIYAPAQLEEGYLRGQRKGKFWFRLFADSKIQECIARGARVRAIRLNVPQGPTGKIVADIILEASDRAVFRHRGKFLQVWDERYAALSFPEATYLGSDLNPIGAHVIALGTETQELYLRAGPNLLQDFEGGYQRLEKYRKWEIPHLQQKLAAGGQGTKKQGRQKAQITLLHQRRARIMKELKEHRTLMVYLYAIHRTGAQYASWDAIQGISPQGRGATLATAVTYMPKARGLLEQVQDWAHDLQIQGYFPQFQGFQLVPLVSSEVCAECLTQGHGLQRTRVKGIPYHEFQCARCGKRGCRHANSGQVAAVLLQFKIENRPLPLSTG